MTATASTHGTATASADDWRHQAACAQHDPELFFPIGTGPSARDQIRAAKKVCWDECPVRFECLQFATDIYDGVWGGFSELERDEMRREAKAAARRERRERETGVPTVKMVLGDESRALIRWAVEAGHSYGDIAQRTGADRDTITRLHRAERGTVRETTAASIRGAILTMQAQVNA